MRSSLGEVWFRDDAESSARDSAGKVRSMVSGVGAMYNAKYYERTCREGYNPIPELLSIEYFLQKTKVITIK
ncbi:hypothetical protein LVD17_00525 [Fulvivirga ulvae]|uniref:hypothetical protein n=1 Tax=Fulvivirga ulvae TaxID=2904245 RepID=UPI001F44B725|nr:hypothetical protein [Fulvivirga ulvae]UII32322.1 hypothetical protein LVD17_00525 [Fulvivirga ulvae]